MVWGPPPDDGGKGYFNINERGDFDGPPRRRRRRRWNFVGDGQWWSVRTWQRALIWGHVLLYAYQLVTAAVWGTPHLNLALSTRSRLSDAAASASSSRLTITPWSPWDVVRQHLLGGAVVASVADPLTQSFGLDTTALTLRRPHRSVTAGLLHGSLLQLVVNLWTLARLPRWCETAHGAPLYLTTYAVSMVAGYTLFLAGHSQRTLLLGASGAVCGLYGLACVTLHRVGRTKMAWKLCRRSLLGLLVLGVLDDRMTNAVHVGGLVGGMAMGLLCGPRVRSSYMRKRYNSLQQSDGIGLGDLLGPDVAKKPSRVKLYYVWIAIALGVYYDPRLRTVPMTIANGLLRPWTLTGTM